MNILTKLKAKRVRIASSIGAAVSAIPVLAIAASAEDVPSSASSGIESVITSAGETLTTQFSALVSTMVPILIGIAVAGLGMYAVIYLFKMAKSFFAKAAG